MIYLQLELSCYSNLGESLQKIIWNQIITIDHAKRVENKSLCEEKKGSILNKVNVTLLPFLKFQRQAADIGDNKATARQRVNRSGSFQE